MRLYVTPSDEQRKSDNDSFTVSGKRMDVFSFMQPGYPFAATCLGHHWVNEEETADKPVITKLRPYFDLVDSGEPNNDFIKNWGTRMYDGEYYEEYYEEYYFYKNKFFNGDLSDEASLKEKMTKSGAVMGWITKLFTVKAIQLLRPVVRSAKSGNPSAIGAISYITHHLTRSLEGISKGNWKEVRKISSNRFYWPVLHSPHPQLKTEQQDSYIANLRVGSKLPVRVDRARWSDDPLSMLAFELITSVYRLRADREMDTREDPFGDYSPQSELGEVCQSLPELTKETAKSHWWPVAREIFSFSYPDPLGVEEFRAMVKYEQDDSSLFKGAFLNALRDKLVSLARR
jgi:hypothetical protein